MTALDPFRHRARTKIVATVGPACREPRMLHELLEAGVDVFRLNMAHGSPEEHSQTVSDIRAISRDEAFPVGILVDLAGPKIRLGEVHPDPLECRRGQEFHFVRGTPSSSDELNSTYELLIDELNPQDRVMLADGTVEMVVTKKSDDRVTCQVVSPGILRSRQGINLPGVRLSVPAMNDVDRAHAVWAAQQQAEFVSLSFVRSPIDILQLKELLRREGSSALAIAKIEKPEALDLLDEIVQAADGIMVARGDLGVEIDVAEMPVEQKQIIETCQRWKKPVIVATQMLDSMQRSSLPTRAEVTDVANAILDGADACMLSGETAIGKFPLESVKMMNRIMVSTEESLRGRANPWRQESHDVAPVHPITSAIVAGAGQIAAQLDAKMVVIATHSGRTALTKAKQRDFIPTVALSDSPQTIGQMCLYWGITPLSITPANLERDLVQFMDQWGRSQGLLQKADRVVFVLGSLRDITAHNQLLVHEVT